ncbi:MAG: SsrA-binding protein SmpB [Alphaproteobacteria bacterium]|nr:SsrA-binding protein SmpB [Alphaproteobacteria bacterium]
MNGKKKEEVRNVVADNRQARRDYQIEETFEAGLVLTGTEVKALREGHATIREAYAAPENDGIWLINATIPEYSAGNRENHEPKRPRKLLLNKRQIAKLAQAVERKGYTIAPLRLYFNERGIAKLEIGIGIGRKAHDKRDVVKERDWSRQQQRLLRDRG